MEISTKAVGRGDYETTTVPISVGRGAFPLQVPVFNTWNGEWMELSHTYTVRYLIRGMENGWSCHTRIL
jgi:hypothetical protein